MSRAIPLLPIWALRGRLEGDLYLYFKMYNGEVKILICKTTFKIKRIHIRAPYRRGYVLRNA
jgi:hypothetical protein